ncbi:MAG: helix-turn-helix domain-containing protein [Rhodoblastus sp.]
MDETLAALAERIKSEREARNWTLSGLAAASGVSKAAISRIERCEMNPTATVLARLAAAFDLTLAALLTHDEAKQDPISRAKDQPVWRDPATGYIRRQIFARADHPVELVEVELPPGARVVMPPSSYARIRQATWVQAGALALIEGGRKHVLQAGDCLGFGAPSEVTFANETERACAYVVALARV